MLLVVLAIVATACDKIEKVPLGDGMLTIVDNQTKGLKGLEYYGTTIFPVEYTDIRLVSTTQTTSMFILSTPEKEMLYDFASRAFGQDWKKLFEAPKIEAKKLLDKRTIFIGHTPQGKTVYYDSFEPVVKGPYKEVHVGSGCYVYQLNNGLFGINESTGVEIAPAKYSDAYDLL